MISTSSDCLRIEDYRPSARRRAILLTTYMTGAPRGNNLGVAGYSYDFVTQLYLPLLQRWGEVVPVPLPNDNLEAAVKQARERGLDPVHVSFLPFQDVTLARSAPNIVVPAWEFPDVPNEPFESRAANDWPAMANQCAAVLVGGPFTENALRKAGTTSPIRVVQVPVTEKYFQGGSWGAEDKSVLDIPGYEFVNLSGYTFNFAGNAGHKAEPLELPIWKVIGKALERSVSRMSKKLLGKKTYQRIKQAGAFLEKRPPIPRKHPLPLPFPRQKRLALSNIVYTSIFNPNDGRKNWGDLLTAFLSTLGDCEDVTLVMKLITSNPMAAKKLINNYKRRDIRHRCKLVFITDYLTDDQMVELAEASTYYIQATKAEGNCLPLMNFLAAGRPGVSPSHSAIADYFDEEIGFVVDSHPEPAAWPHDPRLRTRTTWARIVWPSLCQRIRESYELAKHDQAAYGRMSDSARSRMRKWASEEVVWERLRESLDMVVGDETNRTTESAVAKRSAVA